jgi:hypothetical protein
MAAEETEYYSLHAGNGRSPVERTDKNRTAAKKKNAKQESGKGSRITPYLQGITVGTVLLIPLGVWCWVRVPADDAPATEESTTAHATASKSSKQSAANAASKRKPVKTTRAAAIPATRIETAAPTIYGLEPAPAPAPRASAAANDPLPPSVTAAPAPVPAFKLLPEATEQEDTSIEITRKPKKGVWKTITSPFRGKNKDHPASANEPPPAGQ